MKTFIFGAFLLVLFFSTRVSEAKSKVCKPSGKVKGKKLPPGYCTEDDGICCIQGRYYPTYRCSPTISKATKAVLNLSGFENGGDGYTPSKCDHKYHSDDTPVVALSTGWYSGGTRCLKNITIVGNGRTTNAMVVDECDSSMGCDADHDYLPPCANNLVLASEAVWKALKVPVQEWSELDVTWSDAL